MASNAPTSHSEKSENVLRWVLVLVAIAFFVYTLTW